MSGHLFWLSEELFARLKPLLPDKVRDIARVDDRRAISGIRMKSAAQTAIKYE